LLYHRFFSFKKKQTESEITFTPTQDYFNTIGSVARGAKKKEGKNALSAHLRGFVCSDRGLYSLITFKE